MMLGHRLVRLVVGDEVAQHDLGQLAVDRLAVQRGEGVTRISAPSSSPNVAFDPSAMNSAPHRVPPAIADGLLAQDGDPGLELRWLNVGDQSPLESGCATNPPECQSLGRAVEEITISCSRCAGWLTYGKLLLGTFLALQKLDVIDQQHVDVAVTALEGHLSVVSQELMKSLVNSSVET